jgi:hypothetical protein
MAIILTGLFYRATSFDQPIGDWDTSSTTTCRMSGLFSTAAHFDQPIGDSNAFATRLQNGFQLTQHPVHTIVSHHNLECGRFQASTSTST